MQQPEQNGHRRPLNAQSMLLRRKRRQIGQQVDGQVDREEEEELLPEDAEPAVPQLPPHRLRNALFGGVIIGLLCTAQGVAIVLANAGVYRAASAEPGDKLALSIATTIVGLQALSSLISALISLIGGYIVGKVVLRRRLGFLAGFIAGVISFGVGFLLNYMPSYPGSRPASGTTSAAGIAGGILVTLIQLLIAGILAGLFSLLGSWIATRQHPYYVG